MVTSEELGKVFGIIAVSGDLATITGEIDSFYVFMYMNSNIFLRCPAFQLASSRVEPVSFRGSLFFWVYFVFGTPCINLCVLLSNKVSKDVRLIGRSGSQ